MAEGPDTRKNAQVRQPGIEGYDVADGDGWPTPLTDPSNPLKVTVTNGSHGEQRNFDPVSTSIQDQLSLTEGKSKIATGDMEDQGSHANKWQTSQQNAGDIQMAEGEQGD